MNIYVTIIFVVIIFLFSIILNHLLLKLMKNIGKKIINNGDVRWNETQKPTIGGSTFFVCFLISSIAMLFLSREYFVFDSIFYGIMFAVSLAFVTGLIDDAYSTIPKLKLILQIACGVLLFYTGISINIFNLPILNLLITVFWVVGIMNAINLLDNMDGISTIVSVFIILSSLVCLCLFNVSYYGYFYILIGVLTSLIAFLFYNWYPSKFFMGDTGSMFLGVFLAIFGILYFWNFKSIETNELVPLTIRFLSVILIFALPIIDTTTVFIKRLFIQKKSPFIGGRDHTTHHLYYLGLTEPQVALVFVGLSSLSSFMGILVLWLAYDWKNYYYYIFGIFFVLLFMFLFIVANLNTKKNSNEIK